MKVLDRLEKNDIKEFVSKGWMTHDGMWFYHCLQECGIEKTSRINRAAVRSMATIEIQRIVKVLKRLTGSDIKDVKSFDDFRVFTEMAMDLVMTDFMRFSVEFPEQNKMHVEWEPDQCFAYKGIKGMGALDGYQCGIFERIDAWFDFLGIDYSVYPMIEGCLMHQTGSCCRDYTFNFD